MKAELITLGTAKLAKEKDFNEYCKTGYVSRHFIEYRDIYLPKIEDFNLIHNTDNLTFIPLHEPWYYAPTQDLLQRWLRETHNILVEVNFRNFAVKGTEGYFYMCGTKNEFWTMNNYFGETVFKGFNSYEEAMEVGLQQGLKLVKI